MNNVIMEDEGNILDLPEASKVPVDPKEFTAKAVSVNLEGLRDALFDELNLLRTNKISVKRARVTSQLAKRIIETATMDLFSQNLLGPATEKTLKRLTSPNIQG